MDKWALIFVILTRLAFSLHDKCQYHSDTFWLTKKFKYFRPNWENRYVKNQMGEIVVDHGKMRVKWWTYPIPAFIDGVHLFKMLMWLFILTAVWFGLDARVNYFYFVLGISLILAIIHFAVMQKEKK